MIIIMHQEVAYFPVLLKESETFCPQKLKIKNDSSRREVHAKSFVKNFTQQCTGKHTRSNADDQLEVLHLHSM